jgi:hypothetical protein
VKVLSRWTYLRVLGSLEVEDDNRTAPLGHVQRVSSSRVDHSRGANDLQAWTIAYHTLP